jgi:hypothetical protein
MRKLIFIIVLLVLSSCVTQKRCLQKFPPSTSTVTTITIRDTIIKWKVEEVFLIDTVYLETLTPLNINKHSLITEYCFGQAWVFDSKLYHSLQQKPVEKEIVIKEAIKEIEVIKEITLPPIKVNELTWWQTTRLKLFNWLLLGSGLYLLVAKRKIIFSLIKKLI